MLRTLGKGPALAVLLVDVLKGVAAILLARWLFSWLQAPTAWLPWAVCLCGLAVLLVSADLGEALTLSDRIAVIRNGRVAARFDDVAAVTEEDLGRHMLGAAESKEPA